MKNYIGILAAGALLAAASPAQEGTGPIALRADSHGAGQPLAHFWSTCVGAGRANEGLRASWLEQLKTVHESCGFRYVRFHGLFHDDMFVYRVLNGKEVYNFQYVDDLFDRMLALDVRPFVELGFAPGDLATAKATTFWWNANGSPPSDYGKWSELVRRFVEHCVARYGAEEVRRWYFEVWNEPNLKPFFGGTQAQYFELYKVSVQTIKAIDPQLRVGGPATSNFHPDQTPDPATGKPPDPRTAQWRPIWIDDFLNFARANHLPVDFVSTHPYPQDFAFDDGGARGRARRPAGSTHDDLSLLRKMVDAGPYPKAAIHLTEWSSSPSSRDFTHDSLPEAAFVAKSNLESIGLVDSLSYWTFTDVFEEKGAGNTIFHGGFGLINYQGMVKPAFHAYRFLNQLGDELLQAVPGGVVTRDRKTGRLSALVYNYPAEEKIAIPVTGSLEQAERTTALGGAREWTISLSGLPPGAALAVETLDREHGNVTAVWKAMGSPEPPTREQAAQLREAAQATKQEAMHADAGGRFELRRALDPWSVVLVKQKPGTDGTFSSYSKRLQ